MKSMRDKVICVDKGYHKDVFSLSKMHLSVAHSKMRKFAITTKNIPYQMWKFHNS